MFFIRYIYTLIGQDPEISDYAAKYVWIVMPSIYFHINMMAAAQFAQNQKHTKVQFYALVISAFLHLGLVILFVHVFDWGFTGVAAATNILFLVRFIIVVY
jgi:Na+-driven multidrug efflux pump